MSVLTESAIVQSSEARLGEATRKQIAVSIVVAVMGFIFVLASIGIFFGRASIAEAILGARLFFGVPVAEIDALKVLAVGIGAFIGMLHGLIVMVAAGAVALTAFVRKQPL